MLCRNTKRRNNKDKPVRDSDNVTGNNEEDEKSKTRTLAKHEKWTVEKIQHGKGHNEINVLLKTKFS